MKPSFEKVPNIVHFVLVSEQSPPFSIVEHLVILAAKRRIQPEKIYFHYHQIPTGTWWELTKPHLVLNQVAVSCRLVGVWCRSKALVP